MAQIYVLDTSVLIHDPHSIKNFDHHRVIIPLTVLSELDVLKAGNSQASYSAREAARIIDTVIEAGYSLQDFSKIPGTNVEIRVMGYDSANTYLPPELDISVKDNQIISTACRVSKIYPKEEVVLVSKDAVMRLTAESIGISAQNYKKDKVSNSYIFKDNSVKVELSQEQYDKLINTGEISLPGIESIKDHSLVSCDFHKGSIARTSILVKTSCQAGDTRTHFIRVITNKSISPWGVRAKNSEQLYALYLLMEPSIKLVTMMGLAGVGKTILSMAAGLAQTCDDGRYKKIIVMRPTVSAGEEIGFLPGSIEEKLEPWMKPIHDNVECILKDKSSEDDTSKADYLFKNGTIGVEAISFVRGRSLDNSFIYIDESQNLTPTILKLLISRAGSRSKVIVAGDIDQIDTPYLDKYSCGLAVVAERFKDEPIAGHVIMTKSERSKLAQLAAELL
jgi:PhoH-like ATPase